MNYYRVATVPTKNTVVSIYQNIEPNATSHNQCVKCLRYLLSVTSDRLLPPDVELSFPVRQDLPSTSNTFNSTKLKSSCIVTYGRVIAGDDVRSQMQVFNLCLF